MFELKQNPHPPYVGLSLMLNSSFAKAAHPLLVAGDVEVLEWSFDIGWNLPYLPSGVKQLLDFYSERNLLLGHGVTYSLLSAQWGERSTHWLKRLKAECQHYNYRHISEHFGWMSAGSFAKSAPLSMPLTADTLRIGQEHLYKLAQSSSVPIGLENLAFAFGLKDVLTQGLFLEQLLATVDGFLVLDLHNLFCQMHNFQLSADDILEHYPLKRVRELHISGGSWSQSTRPGSPNLIRRDTHDDAVPEEVFQLLPIVLKQCPTVEAIIFERLGHTLNHESEINQFRQDFYRIKQIVNKSL